MISSLSGSSYALQRISPFILDPVTAVALGHSASRQPPVASSIQVRARAAGSVIIAGVVDGVSTSETLTFAGAGFKATGRRFTSISKLTPSGAILGTLLEAKGLGADGTPHEKMTSSVTTGWPGAFSPGTPSWARKREAQVETRDAMIAFDYRDDLEPRRADLLLDETTGERWLVEGVNLFRGGTCPHHWEVHVSLWDGEAPG